MDVTKTPPLAPPPSGSVAASVPGAGSQSSATVAAALDRADIRPLDVPAALRILIAEVRASFDLTALGMESDANVLADSPPQAARAIVQLFLQAIPQEGPDMPAWIAAVSHVEAAVQAGLDRGIAAIVAWRDVPPMVVGAAKDTHALIFSALSDDTQNPAWLRPEWAGFAPRLERFRRRRRLARRGLTDPDYAEKKIDDEPR
jgi:hypothetical protein